MSAEPNGTMTTLANSTESPITECINQENVQWIDAYARPQYMWFIFVLGFIENLFVISVFVLHKSRCTVTEIYLGNMAATDLIFVSRHPFWAIYLSNNYNWLFGDFMCKAVASLFRLNLYSSIYFLMMVSIDRYLALVKATSVSLLRKPWCAKVNCGIVWIFAALLSVPYGLFRRLKLREYLNTTACILDTSPDWFIAVNIATNVVGFLVPLVVTAFCTYHMIRVLRKKAKKGIKKVHKERRATWLVLSVFLAFIVCWTPYNIHTFINTLHEFHLLSPSAVSINCIIYHISIFIVHSNSCINPIIYCIIGNHFRQKAREVYSRLLCKGPDRRRSSLPTDGSVSSTQSSFSMGPYKKESFNLICDCNFWACLHQSEPQDSTNSEARPPPHPGCLSEHHSNHSIDCPPRVPTV